MILAILVGLAVCVYLLGQWWFTRHDTYDIEDLPALENSRRPREDG